MARLVCPETGEEAASDTLGQLSPSGGLYDVQHNLRAGITRELFDRQVAAPESVELVTLPSHSPAHTQPGKIDAWIEALDRVSR